MKKFKIAGFTALSLVVLSTAVWFGSTQTNGSVQAAENNSPTIGNMIGVMGKGEISIEPDIAYVTIGIETEAETAEAAQLDNANKLETLLKAVKEGFEVKDEDIQTTGFHVQPRYQYTEGEQPKIVGYTASHRIQINYRELDQLVELLDVAATSGANRIDRIQFDTEKTAQYELQALEKAMANAKAKADAIAGTFNAQIKDVVYVTEAGFTASEPLMGRAFADEAMTTFSLAAGTEISTGQIKITAQVNVQYRY